MITEEECLKIGGHCYSQTSDGSGTITDRYSEQTYIEICKHCPAWRKLISKSEYRYEYPDGNNA